MLPPKTRTPMDGSGNRQRPAGENVMVLCD